MSSLATLVSTPLRAAERQESKLGVRQIALGIRKEMERETGLKPRMDDGARYVWPQTGMKWRCVERYRRDPQAIEVNVWQFAAVRECDQGRVGTDEARAFDSIAYEPVGLDARDRSGRRRIRVLITLATFDSGPPSPCVLAAFAIVNCCRARSRVRSSMKCCNIVPHGEFWS